MKSGVALPTMGLPPYGLPCIDPTLFVIMILAQTLLNISALFEPKILNFKEGNKTFGTLIYGNLLDLRHLFRVNNIDHAKTTSVNRCSIN